MASRFSGSGMSDHEHKVHEKIVREMHEFGKRIGAKPGLENDRKIARQAELIAKQTKDRIETHKRWKR